MKDLLSDGRRRYYSVKEVADYFGLSRSKAYKLVSTGEIAGKSFGGALRVSREEILRYERDSHYSGVAS